jgi:hypothetical protein
MVDVVEEQFLEVKSLIISHKHSFNHFICLRTSNNSGFFRHDLKSVLPQRVSRALLILPRLVILSSLLQDFTSLFAATIILIVEAGGYKLLTEKLASQDSNNTEAVPKA